MFRFIITVIFLAIFGIISLPILGVLWIMGKIKPEAKSKGSLAVVKCALKIVTFLDGIRLTIIGYDKVPENEAVQYVANHSSIFDIVVTLPLVKTETAFISKKENRVPILAQYMENMHGIFFDRNDMKQGMKTILDSIEMIKKGISVFIYPEGTRTKTGELNPFKEGSFKIAAKTGCKVVPIAITGTADVFENHLPRIKSREVIVEFGDPFVIAELDEENRKFPGKYAQALIQSMLDGHKA